MSNISGQDELVTKQELAAFYQAILPYLSNGSSSGGGTTYTAGDGIDIINDIISTKKSTSNDMDEIIDTLPTGSSITTVSGYTPLGTIISYYGETAPRFYLACDGSEYNKSDYPELANHLLSLTNHSQYEVSGNDTKFKVPDLRGEFLRGTGTNSHAKQGNGANVGVHQDATIHPRMQIASSKLYTTGVNIAQHDNDYSENSSTQASVNLATGSASQIHFVTSRPTNTSVLYCIAYKDIYTSPMNDYSTDEKVVGTWIDGKPLYQKTLSIINKSLSSGDNTIIDDPSFPSISTLISISLINYSPNHNTYHDVVRMYPNAAWTGGINYISTSNGLTIVYNIGSNYANEGPFNIYVTVQYTKTTD